MRDYYEILGVPREADTESIKKAYRKLALQYHPDRNNGSRDAEELFKEATEAYEVLRDGEKRAAYDRFGHAGLRSGAGASGFSGFDFSDALEIFMRDFGGFASMGDLFGAAGRRGGGPRRGADMRVRLPITLGEVASGAHKTIRLKLNNPCSVCSGMGAEPGSSTVRCNTCAGTGEIRRVQRSFLGQMVSVTPCAACAGEGQRIERTCHACGGRGIEQDEQSIELDVPAGVSTGDYITMRGQGNFGGRGGVRGDIQVVLEVQEDARFKRDGAHLVHDLAITFSQAALGAEIEVPTLTGTAQLRVPAGIQAGRLLRMRGKGLPQLQGGGRGDLIVRIIVWTPSQLTAEQEALMRRLAQIEQQAPRAGQEEDRGFWSKVREAFGG
ncbi:MAG: molecular chaperone DnaJ [Longimicrobiales bacterium]